MRTTHLSPPASTDLLASIVDDAYQLIAVVRGDGCLGFVSAAVERHLDRAPTDLVGRAVADLLHPDDLERAGIHLGGFGAHGAPAGTTRFRFQHADGRWSDFDVTAAQVRDADGTALLAVYCTPVDHEHATDEVLSRLLQGATRSEALAPVLDAFSWRANDARVAISWTDLDGTRRAVSTGLPPALAGAEGHADDPWAIARRSSEPVLDHEQTLLDPERRRLAAAHGRGGLWIVPVEDPTGHEPALITVWSRADGPRVDGHGYGMSIATTYVQLILRFTDQVARLQGAARRDPLTGLANRRALFERLDEAPQGALLFCDLDHFKPVNDRYGHEAGDELLRRIARRLEAAVRGSDLVARTGGDEFVVLAPGIDPEQAAALAQRIRTAVAEPTEVDGEIVQVGVTIGVAYAADVLTERTLGGADQALMNAKARDRGTVRWAAGTVTPAQLPPPEGDAPSSSAL
ncbi:MAG: sensor domain-containing diguanylate cyclase [Acidimicrobiales bacterium]